MTDVLVPDLARDRARAQSILESMQEKPIKRLTIDDLGGIYRWCPGAQPTAEKPRPTRKDQKQIADEARASLRKRVVEYLKQHGPTLGTAIAKKLDTSPTRVGHACAGQVCIRYGTPSWGGNGKTYWIVSGDN
jgi:hypothetical protein